MTTTPIPVPEIRYTVAFPNPGLHLYHVTLNFQGFPGGRHVLSLPVWTPGAYEVQDFSKNLFDLRAEAGGAPVPLIHEAKSRWALETPDGVPVTVHYQVYAFDLGVDTSHLDDSHAYFNGAQLFFCVDGRKEVPLDLTIAVPPHWHVSTGLDPHPTRPGTFRAKNYDILIDSPVEVGSHPEFQFTVDGKPHTVAIWGHGNEDPVALTGDIERIVKVHRDFFGGLPYEHYTFILHLPEKSTGGLEHLNSTTCGIQRFMFRPRKQYRKVLALISHEFFHLWNVKRIHPEMLGPFDYDHEVYTHLLWAMEGFTDYYATLGLERAALYSPKEYLDDLASRIGLYEKTPGRLLQSLDESSFDTWIKLYKPGPDSPNRTMSYYLKGDLVGLALDLALRRRTEGRGSLDHVLRHLYDRYGRYGQGFPEQIYQETVEEVGEGSFQEFFDRYIHGVDPLPLDTFLGYAGLAIERGYKHPEREDSEANGKDTNAADHKAPSQDPLPWLGVELDAESPTRVVVKTSLRPGPAADLLYPGDQILALNGYQIDQTKTLSERLHVDHRPGDVVEVAYFRGGRLSHATLTLGTAPFDDVRVVARPDASPDERALYEAWLGHPWKAPED